MSLPPGFAQLCHIVICNRYGKFLITLNLCSNTFEDLIDENINSFVNSTRMLNLDRGGPRQESCTYEEWRRRRRGRRPLLARHLSPRAGRAKSVLSLAQVGAPSSRIVQQVCKRPLISISHCQSQKRQNRTNVTRGGENRRQEKSQLYPP